ncbi:Ferredoxin--NADP reductase [Candidatus Hodgkinia cicadicola]|uniref:Ferredoxin--NADP reductase n=1 Tax=Candidatus Hodgkinia cicadicola TaxID=573658 RepID=A0ABX4MHI6_9HYPH|nr:Ferredoxin--NADP reductase [Candidatus Hodgkinia cicadicola]
MYATIGLIIRKELVFRDYYICNPTWDNRLEFYSMTVPNGLFTSFFRKIVVKSSVIIKTKTNGELTLATLKPGKRLFLFCSDIGIIPAISIISEPETYFNFNEVVVVISCKHTKKLSYFNSKLKQLAKESKIKPYARGKLRFYQSITQEPYPYSDNITWLIRSGTLIADLRTHTFNKMDRFMVCGQQMAVNNIVLLKDLGYDEGAVKHPGDFTYEKKFINPILNLSPGSDVLLGRIKTEHPNQQLQLPSPEGTGSKEIIIISRVYSRGGGMLETN